MLQLAAPQALAYLLVALSLWYAISSRRQLRVKAIPFTSERVLIIGASSGIGQSIAHQYAARGAHICLVARREKELEQVATACRAQSPGGPSKVVAVVADCTLPEDIIRVRQALASGIPLKCLQFDRLH